MESRRRALVIGGSLGGLFAANLLHRIGWDVQVFERVPEDLASRGAGIGTHEELFAVMRRIGLAVDETIGVTVATRLCLDRDGSILCAVARPQTMSAWARLYRPLRAALPAERYHAGTGLERIETGDGGVTAVFADGARAEGDLLVGADGLRSTVRAQVLPDAEPQYAGYLAWRGVVDEGHVPADIHDMLFRHYVFCLPPGDMMLAYPVPGRDDDVRPGRRAWNWVWYRPATLATLAWMCTDATGRRHGLSIPPPLIRADLVRTLREDARAVLAPAVATLVADTAQPFFQPIFDLESPRLVFGRAALLGDAAFVARPHVGAGVSKAALDAACLADALAATDDVDEALRRYEAERLRFGRGIVARARWLGAYLEAQHKPGEPRFAQGLPQDPVAVLREIGARLKDIPELAGAL